MKSTLLIAASALLLLSCQKQPERTTLLDLDWQFTHVTDGVPSGETINVNLPHDFSIEGAPDRDAPSFNDGGYFPTGAAVYTKTLSLPSFNPNDLYTLVFEGVYMDSKVYVNGNLAGVHPYGYSTFEVDATPYLHKGDNEIKVEVDNSKQLNCRWYSGSGIYRHVWLLTTPAVHLSHKGLYITTPDVDKAQATVNCDITVTNATDKDQTAELTIKIANPAGEVIATEKTKVEVNADGSAVKQISMPVASPELWSPSSPSLYTLTASLTSKCGRDEISEHFGIRKFEYSAENGLTLNGEPIVLNGGCVHHDNGVVGAASFDAAEARKVKLLKQAGFNAVRTSHNPPAPAFLRECDRQGLIVIDEAFDGWYAAKTQYDYSTLIDEWWDDDIAAMVLRDRNHPSIMCWSIGNEIIEHKSSEAVATAHKLASKCRELDPSRPVTSALAAWDADWEIYDPLAAEHDIVGYNYLMHKVEGDHERVPSRVMWQTESYPRDAFENWVKVDSLPYVIGDFVWTAIDYLGESGIGRHYYEGEVPGEHWERPLWPWHGALCGDIDITGYRKPISHYRAMLYGSDEPLYMAVKEPNGYVGEICETLWGTYPTYESWTWPGWEGKPIEVEVYTKSPSVSLYLDDALVGEKAVSRDTRYKAVFELPYQAGTIKAVDAEGNEVKIATAVTPASIRLSVDNDNCRRDGTDVAFVIAELLDEQGTVVPNADVVIEFNVDGPASVIGTASADMKDNTSYATSTVLTHRGRAIAAIRPTAPGDIKVKATAPGLSSAITL